MTKTPSESTQFALLGKDISQIQKDLSGVAVDVKALMSARFVTQNEMQIAIKESRDETTKEIAEVSTKLTAINKILWLIFSTFTITVIGAFAKLVLKV